VIPKLNNNFKSNNGSNCHYFIAGMVEYLIVKINSGFWGNSDIDGSIYSVHIKEPVSKRPILADLSVGLKFQSSKYYMYSCG